MIFRLAGRLGNRLVHRLGLTTGRCPVCGALNAADSPFCSACTRALRPRTRGHCPRCGLLFGDEKDSVHLCADCRLHPKPWNRLYFHGPHEGPLRELILSYKFGGGLHVGRILQGMAESAFERGAETLPDMIVPVPLHPRRLQWRGYNQSIELARRLSREHSIPLMPKALVRTRNTVPQTRVAAGERHRNIKNAFEAIPKRIRGKSILLVDDVLTTGATLAECAKTLRRAGSSTIDVLVLGVAQSNARKLKKA